MKKLRLLLVDDQILFVESLKIVLEKISADIQVVGVASNGLNALELVEAEKPDVVLMDVRMPEMSGVKCTRIILERYPEVKVLMLTTFDDDEYVFEALSYGAAGYLLKNVPPLELVSAIHSVYEGGVTIAPKVASKLVKRLVTPADEKHETNDFTGKLHWINDLSNREKEVLILIAQGFDNKEIAKRLYIGEQTVKNYVSVIYFKLGIRDRVYVARMATEAGLV
jgi:DNA-binding NarL/FixJ family response regulator